MRDEFTHRPKPIVVGTGGSQRGHAAVVRACILAYSRGAQLHVVSVYSRPDSPAHRSDRTVAPRDIAYTLTPRQEAAAIVTEALAVAAGLGVEATGHTVQGTVVHALAHLAADANAEAIVVGSSRRRSRLTELLTRGVSRALVAARVCPVVVVETAHGPVHRLISNGRRVVELQREPQDALRHAS